MSPDELRDILQILALSQVRVSNCIGISDRTMRSWLTGEREVPEPVARLLRLAVDMPGFLDRFMTYASVHNATAP